MIKVYQTKFHAGMTDQNSLARGLAIAPSTIVPGIISVLGNYYQKFGVSYLTQGRGNFKVISNDEYDWNLQDKIDKAIPVKRLVTATATPGIAGSIFEVVYDEPWFGVGDIIAGDRGVLARVQAEGTPVADGTLYKLRLMSPDPTLFMPLADLEAGKKFHISHGAFEEFSRGGHSNAVTPGKQRNQLTIDRMKDIITGHTRTQVAVFEFTNPVTKKTTKWWLDWKEWLFMLKWYERVERGAWYSIYNRKANGVVDMPGENGRPVLSGAGIWQQMGLGNSGEYSSLSVKFLATMLSDCTFNMKDADDRIFTGFSGEMGFVELHEAMLADARQWTLVDSGLFITGSGQKLELGGQFVTYRGLNGTQFSLKWNPLQDDPEKNTLEHTLSRRPIESYKIGIMDTSSYNNESNLLAVCRGGNGVDRSLMRWHVAGSTTPTMGAPGDFSSNGRASDVDGYEINVLSQKGYCIQNSRSCAVLTNNMHS